MALTLTRETVNPISTNTNQHAWPLVVTAVSDTVGLPSEIFIYHAAMDDDPVNNLDLFECVASVAQLYEIGLTPIADEEGLVVPYYRSATASFACRSPEDADKLWNNIYDDTVDLYKNFNYFNDLQTVETKTIS